MRRRSFEDVHSLAKHAPISAVGPKGRLPLDDDQNRFAVASNFASFLSRPQPIEREADEAPTGGVRSDLMDLTMATEWFS